MQFETVTADLFHHIVDDNVPVEFFLDDHDLLRACGAEKLFMHRHGVILGQEAAVFCGEDFVCVFGSEVAVKVAFELFDSEDLGVFFLDKQLSLDAFFLFLVVFFEH